MLRLAGVTLVGQYGRLPNLAATRRWSPIVCRPTPPTKSGRSRPTIASSTRRSTKNSPVTVYKQVTETQYQERRYKVAKPVYETAEREERYTVERPVWETQERVENYTVMKPVYETSEREEQYTVYQPVTTYRTEYVDQGCYSDQQVVTLGRTVTRLR